MALVASAFVPSDSGLRRDKQWLPACRRQGAPLLLAPLNYFALVAQWLEHRSYKAGVDGSNPSKRTNKAQNLTG